MIVRRHSLVATYLVAFIVLCDQLSKWWVLYGARVRPDDPMFVTPYLNIVLVLNRGVTFGILNKANHDMVPWILVGIAAFIVFLLGRWLWKTHSMVVALGLGCVIGGALGNIADRIRFGAVIDFLDFHAFGYHWYAFNVADAAIVTGVCLLLLDSLVRAK